MRTSSVEPATLAGQRGAPNPQVTE